MSSRDFAFEKAASDGLQVTSNSSQKGSKLKSWKRIKWQGKKELCYERVKPYNLYSK